MAINDGLLRGLYPTDVETITAPDSVDSIGNRTSAPDRLASYPSNPQYPVAGTPLEQCAQTVSPDDPTQRALGRAKWTPEDGSSLVE
jgi:hypothetical protein